MSRVTQVTKKAHLFNERNFLQVAAEMPQYRVRHCIVFFCNRLYEKILNSLICNPNSFKKFAPVYSCIYNSKLKLA